VLKIENARVRVTYGVEIGQPVKRDTAARGELRNNTKGRESRELVIALESPLEVFLCRADAQVVENDITLVFISNSCEDGRKRKTSV
jgi:hypothetical protein